MLSDVCISIQNVSKSFRMYKKPYDRLKQFFTKGYNYYEEFHALRNISFDIPKGTIVGLIGKNGSGKSTLLQIIAGTMTPSSGFIDIEGKISALLELGSGFNPEFTGRENIYMNAAILGMSKNEIEERINEIIEFADIGSFIDQQVKTYSSGMFVRLAFSVSTSLKPEILIVDEALSVGDVAFQKKCFERIKSLIRDGATVLLVSHDMSMIRMLCDRVIYLNKGSIVSIGDPKTVVDEYMKDVLGKDDARAKKTDIDRLTPGDWSEETWDIAPQGLKYEFKLEDHENRVNGSLRAVIERCLILDKDGSVPVVIYSREQYIVRCYIRIHEHMNYFNLGILIRDKYGQDVFGQSINNLNLNIDTEFEPGEIVICDIVLTLNLKHGMYFATLGIQDAEFQEIYFYGNDVLSLDVQPCDKPMYGLVEIPCTFVVNNANLKELVRE